MLYKKGLSRGNCHCFCSRVSAAGVTTYTGQVRSHMPEIQKLMQLDSSDIKEAAAKLTFVDLGIGMSNVDVILKLSRDILDLVLKIQLNGTSGPQLATQ